MAWVVRQIEAEERAQGDPLLATTEELEKAWSRIWSMEEEIAHAKDSATKLVIAEPVRPEPVAPVNEPGNKVPAASTTPDTTKRHESKNSPLSERN